MKGQTDAVLVGRTGHFEKEIGFSMETPLLDFNAII